tara:strand:- start:2372 stop:3280 length:909 start_codon:yes stop_codon:yes gene_type:complete
MNRNMMNRNAGIASFIPQRMNEGGIVQAIKDFGSTVASIPRAFADDLTMGLKFVKKNENNQDRFEAFEERKKSTEEVREALRSGDTSGLNEMQKRQLNAMRMANISRGATSEGRGAQLTDAIRGAGLGVNQFREMTEAQKNFVMMTNPRLRQVFSRHPLSRGHNFEVMPSGSPLPNFGGGESATPDPENGEDEKTPSDFNFFGGYQPVTREDVLQDSMFQGDSITNVTTPFPRLDPIFPQRPQPDLDRTIPVRPTPISTIPPYDPRMNFAPSRFPQPNYYERGIASLFNQQAPRYMFEGIMG